MYHAPLCDNGPICDPPLDVDAMLFEVSNRMARAQLARQKSNSSTCRQRASRILKINSVGGSPQSLQRRRTVTSHTASHRRSELYHHGLQQAQQGAEKCNGRQSWSTSNVRPVPNARPVSWHPSSMGLNRPTPRTSIYETSSRQSTVAYQTVAMNGLPTPMTQPELNQDLPVDPFFSLDNSTILYQQPPVARQGYPSAGLSVNNTYQSCIPFGQAIQPRYTTVPASSDYSTFSPMNFTTQTWAESLCTFPSYTAPPTPDYLPMQTPSEIWQGVETAEQPSLIKSQSKELVGMGLYDKPDRNSFSLDSLTGSHAGSLGAHPHHESLGKGLKLEETWQPPEEEEEEEEEEESGPSDDPKREEPPTVRADAQLWQGDLMGEKALEASYATSGDLSNQSFFFDNNDDYYDGGALGQQISYMASNLPGVTWG